jgi:hypothetical protein
MNNLLVMLFLFGFSFFSTDSHAVNYMAVSPQNLYAPAKSDNCSFFTLQGIPEADPVKPNSPIFAVPKSHPGYKEIYTLIATAMVSGLKLDVGTSGLPSCSGYAEINFVLMHP